MVDKPAGLVVHPAPGHRGMTLVELLAGAGRRRLGAARRPPARPRHLRADDGREARGRAATSSRQLIRAPRGRARVPGAREGAPRRRGPARSRRRSAATRATARAWPSAARGPREARTHFEVERFLDGVHAGAGAARDRAHAPDPGPLRRDRPPARAATARTAARRRARPRAPVPAQRAARASAYSGAPERRSSEDAPRCRADLAAALRPVEGSRASELGLTATDRRQVELRPRREQPGRTVRTLASFRNCAASLSDPSRSGDRDPARPRRRRVPRLAGPAVRHNRKRELQWLQK